VSIYNFFFLPLPCFFFTPSFNPQWAEHFGMYSARNNLCEWSKLSDGVLTDTSVPQCSRSSPDGIVFLLFVVRAYPIFSKLRNGFKGSHNHSDKREAHPCVFRHQFGNHCGAPIHRHNSGMCPPPGVRPKHVVRRPSNIPWFPHPMGNAHQHKLQQPIRDGHK
jgi:hypothetical protein